MSYPVGQGLHFAAAFANAGGTPADPDVVTFAWQAPDDATSTVYTYGVDPEIVRTGAGTYFVDFVADVGGIWRWRWTGSGSGVDTAVESAVAIQEVRLVAPGP